MIHRVIFVKAPAISLYIDISDPAAEKEPTDKTVAERVSVVYSIYNSTYADEEKKGI
jgi:hypothetical protein